MCSSAQDDVAGNGWIGDTLAGRQFELTPNFALLRSVTGRQNRLYAVIDDGDAMIAIIPHSKVPADIVLLWRW